MLEIKDGKLVIEQKKEDSNPVQEETKKPKFSFFKKKDNTSVSSDKPIETIEELKQKLNINNKPEPEVINSVMSDDIYADMNTDLDSVNDTGIDSSDLDPETRSQLSTDKDLDSSINETSSNQFQSVEDNDSLIESNIEEINPAHIEAIGDPSVDYAEFLRRVSSQEHLSLNQELDTEINVSKSVLNNNNTSDQTHDTDNTEMSDLDDYSQDYDGIPEERVMQAPVSDTDSIFTDIILFSKEREYRIPTSSKDEHDQVINMILIGKVSNNREDKIIHHKDLFIDLDHIESWTYVFCLVTEDD